MTVREIMRTNVATCSPHQDLAAAAHLMRERGCGFVPVVDTQGLLVGVLTDRDVCLFASDRGRSMGHIAVADAMSQPVFSGFAADNVKVALETMATHHVRRLPVVDDHGHLHGVVSIDDIVQAPRRRGAPTPAEIVAALKEISAPPSIVMAPA